MIKFEQYLNENKDLDHQLLDASRDGNLDLVKQLIDQGADVHVYNNSALAFSVRSGHLEVVKYLIDKGADIHDYNDQAFLVASSYGHLEIVKYLISKGADIHARNDEALTLAYDDRHNDIVKFLIQKGLNMTKSMNIPEDVQEIAIKNDAKNIKYIKNLKIDLKEKYKHLLIGSEFGFFDND
jgi:ankyrin repeat protein